MSRVNVQRLIHVVMARVLAWLVPVPWARWHAGDCKSGGRAMLPKSGAWGRITTRSNLACGRVQRP
jgi:4-amino-4-deoxy-L-arabinose transferase-like glycosyltransferase